ncbi:mRNA export factor Gle1 [Euwallacea fornicatus]|uniref:mRNA export factor Gle1 n=1 Tax=Euwallacea fornicatus TaxID=995702 RepID=UPI00338E84C0
MDEEFDEPLKRAVLNKLCKITPFISEVTIGPGTLHKPKSPPRVSSPTPCKKLKDKPIKTSPKIKRGLPTRQLLNLLDLERQEHAQKALNERVNLFKKFEKSQEEVGKQMRLKEEQSLIADMQRHEMMIVKASQKFDTGQSTAVVHMTHIRENALLKMKERQEKFEAEKLKLVKDVGVQKIYTNIVRFYKAINGTIETANGCDPEGHKWCESVKLNNEELEKLNLKVQQVQTSLGSELSVDQLNELAQESEEIALKARSIYGDYVTQVQSYIHQKVVEKESVTSSPPPQPIAPSSQVELIPLTTTDNIRISKYISLKDLESYETVMKFQSDLKVQLMQIETDPAFKAFRIDLKKAINIPVNSISGINSEHLLDKYQRLHGLLAGQSVNVGDKQVNASRHPQGRVFCMDFLARKFVMQGDIIVSSSPESAFSYATVMLSLWNDFLEFGQLLLAYFYQFCPYLVPYYIPRQVGDSDQEFYTKLGYQYKDGEIEAQDKFLKRMRGIMRLFFALTLSKPKEGQVSPFNLKQSWKWLASFLKLNPQVDISATALHVFLETVGFQMKASYGAAFERIIQIIAKTFISKCHEAKCSGGALTRLELLVSQYLQTHKFEQPDGYIENPKW